MLNIVGNVWKCSVEVWHLPYLQMEQRGPGPHSFADLQVVLLPWETGRALVIGWQNFNVDCSNGWPRERGRVWVGGPHRHVSRESVNKDKTWCFFEVTFHCSSNFNSYLIWWCKWLWGLCDRLFHDVKLRLNYGTLFPTQTALALGSSGWHSAISLTRKHSTSK